MKLSESDDSIAILQGTEVSLRAQLQACMTTNSTDRDSFELYYSKTQLASAEAKETANMQLEEIIASQHRIALLERQNENIDPPKEEPKSIEKFRWGDDSSENEEALSFNYYSKEEKARQVSEFMKWNPKVETYAEFSKKCEERRKKSGIS